MINLTKKQKRAPAEIFVLTSTGDDAREIKSRADGTRISTIHSFCNSILRENAVEAGVDPRFSILSDSVITNRLLEEVITAQVNDPKIKALIEELSIDVLKETMLSLYRRIRGFGKKPSVDLIRPVDDPTPFLETFERCCRKLVELIESGEDGPEKVLEDLEKILESAVQLASAFDWKTFRRLKRYSIRFKASYGSPAMIQQIETARNALEDFLAVCLDRQSFQHASLLLNMIADFDVRYASTKRKLGLLDYDDLIDKTEHLLWNNNQPSEIAIRYRDKYKFIISDEPQPRHKRILDAIGSSTEHQNHQSRKGITDFINHLFSKVWGEDSIEYLILKYTGNHIKKLEPDVEIIVTPRLFEQSPEGKSINRSRWGEAQAIAQRIQELTLPHFRTPIPPYSLIKPGDITIILSSMLDLNTYEQALADRGIGTRVVGEREFAAASEVQDVLNMLQTMDDTGITNALDLALEESGYALRLLAMQDGKRKYANIRRLREAAQEFQTNGLFSLKDFITHVQGMKYTAEHEAARDDLVNITSIRRAKAKNSPVVILANISRSLNRQPGRFIFHEEWGAAAQVNDPQNGILETPLCHREILEHIRYQAMSDSKHLLYQAVTRAEEHLILVGSTDLMGEYRSTYRETNSWIGWLEKAFALGPGTPEGEIRNGNCRIGFRYGTPDRIKRIPFKQPTLAERFAGELREGRPIKGFDIPIQALEIAGSAVDRCLAITPPTPSVPRLSVSRALDYIECPARYRLLHVIGMPEVVGEPPDDAEVQEFTAADLGHLVHDFLSFVDFSRDVEPQLEALISGVADESLKAQAWPLLEGFAAGHWCQNLRESDRILKEKPFELTVGGSVLAGRMDVLYKSKDGWTILDYKTGRAETRERYELQVGIYAHAAHRLTGEVPAQAGLLLLSIGEEWVQDTTNGVAAKTAEEKIKEVAAAIQSEKFDPIPGKHCEWCPHTTCSIRMTL